MLLIFYGCNFQSRNTTYFTIFQWTNHCMPACCPDGNSWWITFQVLSYDSESWNQIWIGQAPKTERRFLLNPWYTDPQLMSQGICAMKNAGKGWKMTEKLLIWSWTRAIALMVHHKHHTTRTCVHLSEGLFMPQMFAFSLRRNTSRSPQCKWGASQCWHLQLDRTTHKLWSLLGYLPSYVDPRISDQTRVLAHVNEPSLLQVAFAC